MVSKEGKRAYESPKLESLDELNKYSSTILTQSTICSCNGYVTPVWI